MKKELKEKFQEWVNEIKKDDELILTNDLDSLFTVAILRLLFGCEVSSFYDFSKMYATHKKLDKGKLIGCDLAVEDKEIRTFCNHVTKMSKTDEVNPLSANLNNYAKINGTTYGNYFKKYNGSTALMLLSYYDVFDELLLPNHTELTETQLKVIACIDSYFLGAYHPPHYEAYEYFFKWQKCMELEFFQPIFEKYTSNDFKDFQYKNNLKKTITAYKVKEGYQLDTGINVDFLKEHFPMLDFNLDIDLKHKFTLQQVNKPKQFRNGESKHDIQNLFSLAVINRNKVTYTKFKEVQSNA